MALYNETYRINGSEQQVTTVNQQTIVPTIGLEPSNAVELTLRGITYGPDIQPLNGVSVKVYDSQGIPVAQVTTPTDAGAGTYTIVFLGTIGENYRVVASRNGYLDASDEVTFTTTTASRSFLLRTDPNTRVIYGTVVNENGIGIANAIVTIFQGGTDIISVTTGDDGAYMAYDDFQQGVTYTATASALGYTTVTQNVTITTGNSYALANFNIVSTGENFTNLKGKVVIEGTTTPIPNALVGLYLVTGGTTEQLVQTTYTDDFGNYSFSGVLGSATYIVRATKAELI